MIPRFVVTCNFSFPDLLPLVETTCNKQLARFWLFDNKHGLVQVFSCSNTSINIIFLDLKGGGELKTDATIQYK